MPDLGGLFVTQGDYRVWQEPHREQRECQTANVNDALLDAFWLES